MSFQVGLLGGEAVLPVPPGMGTHLSSGLRSAEGRPEAGGAHPLAGKVAPLCAPRLLSVLRTLHWASQEGAIQERVPQKAIFYNPALGVDIIGSLLPHFH